MAGDFYFIDDFLINKLKDNTVPSLFLLQKYFPLTLLICVN